MSANTDLVTDVQRKIAEELLPAVKAAESDTTVLAGEDITIPQQVNARYKQKVQQSKADIITDLNQIRV